jgi:XRE family transcriptional regulator, regulator of sulfur utilization
MGALREGLGRRVHQLRKSAHLTQEQLAGLVGVDPKYLGNIERGEKSASLEVIEKLIEALKIEPYELLLFSLKGRKPTLEKLDEDVLLNLIRRSDKSVRTLLVFIVEQVLSWNLGTKKR